MERCVNASCSGEIHHNLFVVIFGPPGSKCVPTFFPHIVGDPLLGHLPFALGTLPALIDVQLIVEEIECFLCGCSFNRVVAFNTVAGQFHPETDGNQLTGFFGKLLLDLDEIIIAGPHELPEILLFLRFNSERR